jgi:hypothetical protein
MEGRDMTVADRFLPSRMRGDAFDGQIDLDETFRERDGHETGIKQIYG